MTISIDEVWALIKKGRNTQSDWFGEQTSFETIAASLVAMANSRGGTLLIGVVGASASLIGVNNVDSTIDRVLQAALAIDPPLIIPMPRAIRLKNRSIIVIQIPPGMPHVYSLDGLYLRRDGIRNQPLNPRELRRLIIERGELSFEAEIAHGSTLDDINWDKVNNYIATLNGSSEGDANNTLLKRGCLADKQGRLRPTNAGILLFGNDPQRHLNSAEITAVRFAGETMSDTFTRQDIGGSLPDQIRRAETFLIDNLRKGVQLGSAMARAEQFEYPLEAARELVVNAVAHRDYSIPGDNIRLFIFSEHMEVSSPGGLAGPVTVANIKDERFSRNPAIVQVLSDMGFIERLGYGVDRVIDLMQEKHLRAPNFQETAGGFRVSLYNRTEKREESDPLTIQVPSFNGVYNDMPINPRQETALVHLHTPGNSRITNSDLQRLCPDVHAETIRRDLADLVTKNVLEKRGQKRGSYYVLLDDA